MVNGEVVYRDGRFPRLGDGERVVSEAERIGRDIVEKAGLSHRLAPAWRN
jgi:5-methylthioadenosine/S-adenosylhomocysteine deaminase